MLGIFAESLLLATRLTATDPRSRAPAQWCREDEDWLASRRTGRTDEPKH